MKSGIKRFNLDIQTEEENKDASKSPKRAIPGEGRRTPKGGDKSPKNSKSPAVSPKASPSGTFKRSPLNKSGFTRTGGLPSTSNYGGRRTPQGMGQKSPRDPREMWKKPDKTDNEGSDSDGRDFVTKVTQGETYEVFEADEPEVDFDELNENEAASMTFSQSLIPGQEIISDEVSTQNAYQYFCQLEEAGLEIKQDDIAGIHNQLASSKLEMLTQELDLIQLELESLQKEELPTSLARDDYSAKEQLRQVSELKQVMSGLTIQQVGNTLQSQNSKDLELKNILPEIMLQRKILNSSSSASLELSDILELFMNHNSTIDDTQLKKDNVSQFMMLKSSVDECEKIIGRQTHDTVYHKSTNIHSVIAHLQSRIAYTQSLLPNENLNKKQQALNTSLAILLKKQQEVKDMSVDSNKVDFLYGMVENSIMQNLNLIVMLDRLKLIEQMHKQSPALQGQIQKVTQNATNVLPQMFTSELAEIKLTKEMMQKAVVEIQTLF